MHPKFIQIVSTSAIGSNQWLNDLHGLTEDGRVFFWSREKRAWEELGSLKETK